MEDSIFGTMGHMRYLGIDYGTKKVGIALSDEAGTMGFPHSIIPNDQKLMATVRALTAKEGVDAIVIGDSKDFAGDANPVAEHARAFGTALHTESGLPVFYEVEMLTTQEARRSIDGAHPHAVTDTARKTPKGSGARDAVDASAAALILTSYLSRNHD